MTDYYGRQQLAVSRPTRLQPTICCPPMSQCRHCEHSNWTIHRWQQQQHGAKPATPASPVLQQLARLEKQLFAKGDGWRGGMFIEELQRRNTFVLYATAAEPAKPAAETEAASNAENPGCHVPIITDSCRQHQQQQQQQQQQRQRRQRAPAMATSGAAAAAGAASGGCELRHLSPQSQLMQGAQQQEEQQPEALGYVVVQVNSITAHINKLAVAPAARMQGLGTALLQSALRIAVTERRVMCSTLHVDEANTPALRLYARAGFERDGRIPDYYGPGRAALKLRAELHDSPAAAAFLASSSTSGG